jgi:hypothetical protein
VAAAGRTPSLWKVVAETPRTILIACVVAHLLRLLGAKNWKYCVIPGLSLWLFLNHEWVGAVMWEKTPRQIAAIASGNRSSPLWPDAYRIHVQHRCLSAACRRARLGYGLHALGYFVCFQPYIFFRLVKLAATIQI